MSILYDVYRTPNPEKKEKYHARVVANGRVSTDQLAKEIHKESSLTEVDVKAVLMSLADKLAEHLSEGRKVYLEGIGYFQVNLRCKEEAENREDVHADNIEFKSVSYRADNDLKKHLKQQKILRSRIQTHSMPMTDEEIDRQLKAHFSTHDTLTRHEFQIICQQTKSTACRILNRLVENGKLKNIATPKSPLYVPEKMLLTS